MEQSYIMLSQFSYSIKGWNKDLYNWVFVPNFKIDGFSTSKLKTMLYAKPINTKSKYSFVTDNGMIFISKRSPPKKFIDKLSIINV